VGGRQSRRKIDGARKMVEKLIQNLINGAMMGSIYALIALGLSIVYGVMNVVNFAHGDFVMLAMYATFWLATLWGLDPVVTPIITFPLLFLIGVLCYYLLIHRTLRQLYVTQLAVTVGLMIFLRAITQVLFRAEPRSLNHSIITGNVTIGPYTILYSRLISAGVAMLAIAGVYYFLNRTWAGRAIRSASDDLDAASLSGVDYKRTYAVSMGIGSALTGIAGALLMTFQQVDPTMGIRFGTISWCILALAGLGSIPGLLLAGIIVGCAEALAMAFWDPRARLLVVYGIFILVLWLRPRGFFGRK
jgi:branched-chain amino acid transport system permease protein